MKGATLMKKHCCQLSLLLALFGAFATCAAEPPSKTPIDIWLEKAITQDPSTVGIRNATNKAREMWDDDLNKTYQRLMLRLNAKQQEALRTSQRNWIKFRDSEGAVISEVVANNDGTMWQLIATDDGMNLVRARAMQLKAYEAAVNENQ